MFAQSDETVIVTVGGLNMTIGLPVEKAGKRFKQLVPVRLTQKKVEEKINEMFENPDWEALESGNLFIHRQDDGRLRVIFAEEMLIEMFEH